MIKNLLIDLSDELLDLFENKNTLIYKKILYIRHEIYKITDFTEFIDFIMTHEKYIRNYDKKIFDEIENKELLLIWEFCSKENQKVLWKWINAILDTII